MNIVVTVERLVYGHEATLGSARVECAEEPYVAATHTGTTLGELTQSLAETGHEFSLVIESHDVSLIDFMVATGRERELT
jgi:hypothetical protein